MPLNLPSTRARGSLAESAARRFLEALGYVFVEANFYWRGGEIDLVMTESSGTIVFVEVRSAGAVSGYLRYTISAAKRRHLINTSFQYLFRKPWARGRAFRFDLVWIEGGTIDHWKNVIL